MQVNPPIPPTEDSLIPQFSALSVASESLRSLQEQTYTLWLILLQSHYVTHMRPGSLQSGLNRVCLRCNVPTDGACLLVRGELPFELKLYTVKQQEITSEQTLVLNGPMTFTLVDGTRKPKLIPVSQIDDLFTALVPQYGPLLDIDLAAKSLYDQAVSLLHQKFPGLTFLTRLYNHERPLSAFRFSEESVKADIQFLKSFSNHFTPCTRPLRQFDASKICLSHQYYIVSKAPLQSTLTDFWNAVIQEKTTLIVCLSEACRYWELLSIETPFWKISCSDPQKLSEQIIKRTFFVELKTSGEKREITHLTFYPTQTHKFDHTYQTDPCFVEWPDHTAIPQESLMKLLDTMDVYRPPDTGVPIWIHCFAGIGRAPTVAVADNICHRIRSQIKAGANPDKIRCNPRLDVCIARMQRANNVIEVGQVPMLHRLYEAVSSSVMTTSVMAPVAMSSSSQR